MNGIALRQMTNHESFKDIGSNNNTHNRLNFHSPKDGKTNRALSVTSMSALAAHHVGDINKSRF